MQKKFYQVLEQTETTAGRAVDLIILLLIIASVVAFTASTVPDDGPVIGDPHS